MPFFSFLGYTLMELFRKPTIDDKLINKRVRLFINQMIYLRRVEKKKILTRHNKVAKWLVNFFYKIQKLSGIGTSALELELEMELEFELILQTPLFPVP